MKNQFKHSSLVWLTLLCSSSTLLCCTLPVLFVALGFGATLATLTTQLQWWIILAQHKFWLFLISSLLLLLSYWSIRKSKNTCPTDPILAKQCRRIQRWNLIIFRVSLTIWVIGFISAYLAAPLFYLFG